MHSKRIVNGSLNGSAQSLRTLRSCTLHPREDAGLDAITDGMARIKMAHAMQRARMPPC
jgi:hypothetical protein